MIQDDFSLKKNQSLQYIPSYGLLIIPISIPDVPNSQRPCKRKHGDVVRQPTPSQPGVWSRSLPRGKTLQSIGTSSPLCTQCHHIYLILDSFRFTRCLSVQKRWVCSQWISEKSFSIALNSKHKGLTQALHSQFMVIWALCQVKPHGGLWRKLTHNSMIGLNITWKTKN